MRWKCRLSQFKMQYTIIIVKIGTTNSMTEWNAWMNEWREKQVEEMEKQWTNRMGGQLV